MNFICKECGAAPCFLENNTHELDESPFAKTQPEKCPYGSPIPAKWEEWKKDGEKTALTPPDKE